MGTRYLDLNANSILKDWDVEKAIRELLANAIDESVESKTPLPILNFEDHVLTIRDMGRGLNTEHFSYNINPTKTNSTNYIGKYGFGLKDCLAVLHREEKSITIESKYLYVEEILSKRKQNFNNKVLHIVMEEPRNEEYIGTTITVRGIRTKEFKKLKRYFPQYCFDSPPLVETKYGCIYAKQSPNEESIIFINGIRVNEESNFMYHYSIRSNNKKIIAAMSGDRDRNKISKAVYADKVQQILTISSERCQSVRDELANQFKEDPEDRYYELSYADIKKLEKNIKDKPKIKPKIKVRQEVSSSSDSEEEEKARGPIVKPITREDVFLKEVTIMLTKLFKDNVPRLEVKTSNSNYRNSSDILYIDSEDFTTLDSFKRKVMSLYLEMCLADKNEKKLLSIALVDIASQM